MHCHVDRRFVTNKGVERFKITDVIKEKPVLLCEVEVLPEDADESEDVSLKQPLQWPQQQPPQTQQRHLNCNECGTPDVFIFYRAGCALDTFSSAGCTIRLLRKHGYVVLLLRLLSDALHVVVLFYHKKATDLSLLLLVCNVSSMLRCMWHMLSGQEAGG